MGTKASTVNRALLACGAVSGPLFIVALLFQAAINPGFDLRTDLISLLSIGPFGYLQIGNFALCGVLCISFAIGVRRQLRNGSGSVLAPIFVALHGLLLVVVAVFVTDPSGGFPIGSVPPAAPTVHGMIHAGGALWVFLTNAAALAVFARYFLVHGERGWAAYSGLSGIGMLAIFFTSFVTRNVAPVLDVSLAIGWLGLSLVAVKLLSPWASVRLLGRSRTSPVEAIQ
jgi:Protein of unknown function (DUF998)